MRHVITHSVRDSAAVLDVLQGYMAGDWYTAPAAARVRTREEVGADPGRLRIGMRTTAPLGLFDRRRPTVCTRREATARAARSRSVTTVEVAAPAALDEATLLEVFSVVMIGGDARRPARRSRHTSAARSRRPTWSRPPGPTSKPRPRSTRPRTCARSTKHARLDPPRGVVVERRPLRRVAHADARRAAARARRSHRPRDTGSARSLPFALVHRAVQRHRATCDVGADARRARQVLPIGVQLVGARRTVRTC